MAEPRRFGWILLVVLLLVHGALPAAAVDRYVHPTDGTCLGNSPCHSSVPAAITAASNNDTIIVLADVTGTVGASGGLTGITIKGQPATVAISGNVTLDDAVIDGWTLRDIHIGNSVVIREVSGSLTIQNIEARAIVIGPFASDTTADILIDDVTITTGGAENITISADPGIDIGGSITVSNCSVPKAVNIEVFADANPGILSADVKILDNELGLGAGIRALGLVTSGFASITGPVEMSRNTFPDNKLSVFVTGDVAGDISGGITINDNVGPWIAVLTSESNGGDIGPLTMLRNQAEEIEVVIWGDMLGPTLADDNDIIDMGGLTGLEILALLLEADEISGDMTVTNNFAPDNDIVVRSKLRDISGTVVISDNELARLTFEAEGGAGIVGPWTVSGNLLPTADPPLSLVTMQTVSGGDLAGGTFSNNAVDTLTLSIDGDITGDYLLTGNSIREQGTFIGQGLGVGNIVATGNDFIGNTQWNGIDSTVRFNRNAGGMAIIAGIIDSRYNWWLCNTGPNLPGCGETLTAFDPAPWLVFDQASSCTNFPTLDAKGNVQAASDGMPVPAGNNTPGLMSVSSDIGTVSGSPAPLIGGLAAATIDLPGGTTSVMVTTTLDQETVIDAVACDDSGLIFTDDFETGDTTAWTSTVP